MIKTSAPGNIFFFGEHSVVYERPAIVAAIGKRTYSKIKGRDDDKIIVKSKGYGTINGKLSDIQKWRFVTYQDYKDVMDPIRDLIRIFSTQIKKLNKGFQIKITSDIPKVSGGMSSSTAVLCSVLKALDSLFKSNVSREDYYDYIYPIQVKIHGGAASGSEITSSSMGGYNWVRIDKSGKKAKLNSRNLGEQKYQLIIGDTKVKAQTAETVPYVRSGWERDKGSYERIFDNIAKIAKEGKRALLKGNSEKVGELMNENQKLLRILGVSHPKLEELIKISLDNGAYGAKLSAGGKGGIMIALVNEKAKNRVANAIKLKGGVPYITNVGVEGVRIER